MHEPKIIYKYKTKPVFGIGSIDDSYSVTVYDDGTIICVDHDHNVAEKIKEILDSRKDEIAKLPEDLTNPYVRDGSTDKFILDKKETGGLNTTAYAYHKTDTPADLIFEIDKEIMKVFRKHRIRIELPIKE